ncbi:MAG TPA: SigE family RNA polymerase sigma factor [Mycobacteriales bacterium]|nr:SigE family RNA polymerase sigma factor [Mycobacteriales bacterium]
MDTKAQEQFREFVAGRSPALLRTAYLLTGSHPDAEDLLQTALAKTYLRYDRIRDKGALESYVRRAMVTTQTSFWRRRARGREFATDQVPDRPPPGGEDAAETTAIRDAMWRSLGRLGARQRAVLVLRYYEDLSEAETADILGVAPGTVKSQAARALATLRADADLAVDFPLTAQGATS